MRLIAGTIIFWIIFPGNLLFKMDSAFANTPVRTVPTVINRAIRINTGHVMRQSIQQMNKSSNNQKTHLAGRINDTPHGKVIPPVFTIKSHHTGAMTSLAFTPDDQWCIAGSKNGSAQLWDLKTGQKTIDLRCPWGPVLSVAYVKNNKWIATGHQSGITCLWDMKTWKKIKNFVGHKGAVFSIRTIAENHLITAGQDGFVKIWDMDSGKLKSEIPVQGVSAINIFGDKLLTGCKDGKIFLHNLRTHEIESILETGSDAVLALDLGRSNLLAVGLNNGHLQLWNLLKKRRIFNRKGHQSAVRSIAFNPKCTVLASGGDDQTIGLWSVAGGNKIAVLKGHTAPINDLKYSSNGCFIFSAGSDHMVRVWQNNLKKEVARLVSMDSGWAAISPSGFFDGNLDGEPEDRPAGIHWQVGKSQYNVEGFLEGYYKPGLLGFILRKEFTTKGKIDISKGFLLPPKVKISNPASGTIVNSRHLDISYIAVNQGGGIDEIKMFHNDKILFNEILSPEDKKKYTNTPKIETYRVHLVQGENTFRLVGINDERVESIQDTIKVFFKSKKKKKLPDLHVVVIGINKYKNPVLNLDFAVPDALSLSGYFNKNCSALYRKCNLYELFDHDATKNNIQATLELLADTPQQDTIILYFSGHGDSSGDNWYFIPYDLTSPNNQNELIKNGCSSFMLQSSVARMGAHHILLLLDSCKSGAAVTAFDSIRKRRPFALLSRFTGIHIAAATSKSAFELETLGHGLFTYSFLEGLNKGADIKPADKYISVLEIMDYLRTRMPVLAQKYGLPRQEPILNSMGMNFFINKKP